MCECEYNDVRVIGYVRVEMCECERRCASSTFVLVTSFHLVSEMGYATCYTLRRNAASIMKI